MKRSEEIKKNIFKKFLYNDKLKYNEIWDKKICSSSHFDYYLKHLIEENIIEKEGEYYKLTAKGISKATSIDGKSLKEHVRPIPCAFILANEGDKILLNIRKKQPFLNILNIPGGKIEFGEFSENTAKREFKEETGLDAENLKLGLICEKITYNDGDLSHHIIGYFYITKNVRGKLLEKTREGENFWINVKEFKNYERFPDLDIIIPHLVENKPLKTLKIKRWVEKGKFTNIEIVK